MSSGSAGASISAKPGAGPRRVRLTIARIDPWSALKLSLLLSVALGVGLVTGAVILWEVLNGMGVFSSINSQLKAIGGAETKFDIAEYVGLDRVVSISTLLAVVNVLIIMALTTLGSLLYNIAGSLVGGLSVTLSDD